MTSVYTYIYIIYWWDEDNPPHYGAIREEDMAQEQDTNTKTA